MSSTPRLRRLFASDGRCFDVAVDHGFFNELSFLAGIEDMGKALGTLVAAGPDAIQLTLGQASQLQDLPIRPKPALVLRTDVANCYGKELPKTLFSQVIEKAVEQALAQDAACVVVNLLQLPGESDLHYQCAKNVSSLKATCETYGMPLMVEPLVMQSNEKAGGYMVDGDIAKILPLVRQAVELGADIIKADPCDKPEEYHRVIEIASGVPVLVRGGGKASEEEIFSRTEVLMKQGARGIVYGRNVIQHPKPLAMTRALMALVHNGADAARAMKILSQA